MDHSKFDVAGALHGHLGISTFDQNHNYRTLDSLRASYFLDGAETRAIVAILDQSQKTQYVRQHQCPNQGTKDPKQKVGRSPENKFTNLNHEKYIFDHVSKMTPGLHGYFYTFVKKGNSNIQFFML